jgi:hypothetical protein
MFIKFAVTISLLAIGGIGGAVLHAQTAAAPAYLIAHVQVTDADGWKQYITALPATMAPYHVKTLVAGAAGRVRFLDSARWRHRDPRLQQHGRSEGVVEFAGLSSDHSAA